MKPQIIKDSIWESVFSKKPQSAISFEGGERNDRVNNREEIGVKGIACEKG